MFPIRLILGFAQTVRFASLFGAYVNVGNNRAIENIILCFDITRIIANAPIFPM